MSTAVADDFNLVTAGGRAPCIDAAEVDGATVRLILTAPLPPGSCTTVWHIPTFSRIGLGYLPGDAGGDGLSGPLDILTLIDHLNGALDPPLDTWQCDINRSGVCEPQDILRLIDLLNGAAEYAVWNGAQLPPCPD